MNGLEWQSQKTSAAIRRTTGVSRNSTENARHKRERCPKECPQLPPQIERMEWALFVDMASPMAIRIGTTLPSMPTHSQQCLHQFCPLRFSDGSRLCGFRPAN